MAMKFDFGQNWLDFVRNSLDFERIVAARKDFDALIKGLELQGKTFLDIGFGQGLVLMLAMEKGAIVTGNDVNPKCAEALAITQRHFNYFSEIPVIIGSILDDAVIGNIQRSNPPAYSFDVVYSWGVLHHTGDMKKAIRNCAALVAEGGHFVLAIYDRHFTSFLWRLIKWLYCASPSVVQRLLIRVFIPIIWLAKLIVTGKSPSKMQRGMDFYYNVVDWVGGYPYEYASVDEVIAQLAELGFSCVKCVPATVPTGCNEFVFRRK